MEERLRHLGNIKINIAHIVINQHGPIFADLIDLLSESFRCLHFDSIISQNQLYEDRLNILVGGTCFLSSENLTAIANGGCPCIIFQMEALSDSAGFLQRNPLYVEFLRTATQVWDYNEKNARYLLENGCLNVRYIPIGYSSVLERIPPCRPEDKDIDVLFYGAMKERRSRVLQTLQDKGMKIESLFGVYGRQRDEVIARSRIVLNVHQFDTSQLEQVRISYLLNNACFVISETSDCNPYGDGVVFCPYDSLVNCCEKYLAPGMEAERNRIARLGYTNLKSIPMLKTFESALERK